MSRKSLFIGFALVAAGTAAFAEIDPQVLAEEYRAQGYTWVEVTVGATHVEIEAIRDGTEVETVYDRATGAVLATETEPARARDRYRSGVEIRTTRAPSLLDDDHDSSRSAYLHRDDCDDD